MRQLVSVVLIVLLNVPSIAVAGPGTAVSMPVAKESNFTLVRLDGADAKTAFIRAISPEGFELARQRAKERKMRVTDTFTLYEIKPKPGMRKTQTDIGLPGGRVLVWDWEDYDLAYTSGTMIVETWNPSTSTVFDFRYWQDDYWGNTAYTRFIEGRDRDGRLTRASAMAQQVNMPRLLKTVLGAGLDCQSDRAAWRSCLRECLKAKLNASVWAAVGGGIGSVKGCALNATRVGMWGPYVAAGVFMGCVMVGASFAGGLALVYNFGVQEPCDAAANCGPQPSCQ